MVNNDIHYIRKELDNLQTKVRNFDVTTEYAYSTSDTIPPLSDATWSDEKPVPQDGYFIWARNIMNMGYGDIVTEPYCIGDGLEHIISLDVEYIAHSDPYEAPSQSSEFWQTTAPSIQAGQYIWSRTKIVTTYGTTYTSPVRLTGLQGVQGSNGIDGKAGKDGKGIEFIFKRVGSKIDNWNNPPSGVTNPATLTANQTDDYVPTGWTDDQVEVTAELPFQYVSTRTKSVATGQTTGLWGQFNTPKLWSVYGEKPYCHIRYADVNNPQNWNQTYANPQTSGNNEVNYHKYEGYLWNDEETLSVANQDPTLFTWRIYRPTIGIAGEEGSFLHIQFADDEAGTNMNQYDGDYMGTCVTWEEEDPNDADLYHWVRIRGNDGITTEFVYYTTDSASYSSLPSNIQNTPALKKWCERPFAVSESDPYCYVSVKDSDSSTWTSPVLWAKYGEKGSTGATGERGEDGAGLEMIFARNSSTSTAPTFTGSGNQRQDKSTFTGTVTRDNVAYHFQDDDYVPQGWTDDQQGVTSNTGEQVEWVAMRFKRVPANGKEAVWESFNAPKVWATYSEDGRSVVSIQEQYALHTSYTQAPTTGWQNSPPANEQGKFYWTRSVITYDSGSPLTQTTNAVCVSGVDGIGVHYVYYVTNTLSTPNAPTWSNINQTVPSNPYDKWLEDPYPIDATHKYIYISESTTYNQSNGQWSNFSTPALWSRYATDGTNGSAGQGIEYAYYTTDTQIATSEKPTVTGVLSSSNNAKTWSSVPVPMTAQNKYMYISYRTKTGSIYGSWSNSALWSQFGDKGDQGEKGADGRGMEHIYKTNTTNTAPSFTNNQDKATFTGTVTRNNVAYHFQDDDFVPSGWSDDPVGVNSTNKYEFVSIRTKYIPSNGDGKTAVWGDFSTPVLWNVYYSPITEVINKYLASASSSGVTSATSGWTESIQSMTSAKPYLWNYEIIKSADGQVINESTPCIIGRWGQNGSAGRGISAITEHFAVNNDKDNAPSSGWVSPPWTSNNPMPTTSETNRYLWNYETLTYVNGTPATEDTTKRIISVHGERGTDGTSVQVGEVVDAVTGEIDFDNINAKTVGNYYASEFMMVEPDSNPISQSSGYTGTIECRKLGYLIIININNWTVTNKASDESGWQNLKQNPSLADSTTNYLYIPQKYRPSDTTIVGGGTTAGTDKSIELRAESDGSIRFKRRGFQGNTSIVVYGTFVFFVDTRTSSYFQTNASSTLYVGDSFTVTLKESGTNTVLANKKISISINGVSYPRTTNSNGQASVKLNLPANSNDGTNVGNAYTVGAEFNGDSSHKPSGISVNTFRLRKATPTITNNTQSTVGRSIPIEGIIKNNNNNTIKSALVKVTINSKSYTGKTNSAGKFSILHPNDGLAYDNTSHNIKIEVVSSDYSWATTSSNDIIFSRTFYG